MAEFIFSENAEVRYYPGGGVNVDNLDSTVEVEEKEFNAHVKITKDGDVDVTPFGSSGTSRGPRSRTICDTGVAKIKKSPKGLNVKVEILLPIGIASERNFRHHLTEVFEKLRDKASPRPLGTPLPNERGENSPLDGDINIIMNL